MNTNSDNAVSTTTEWIDHSDHSIGSHYFDKNRFIEDAYIAGRLHTHNTWNFSQNRKPLLNESHSNGNWSSARSNRPSPPSPTSSGLSSTESLSPPKKSFTCPECHKSFGYKHVLQNHLRTHTGEKPYGCDACGRRFTRDHHLKVHIRLHTGERPYPCTRCKKRFVQVANLRRHQRICKDQNGNYKRNAEGAINLSGEFEQNKHRPRSMKFECPIELEQSEPEDLSTHSLRFQSPPTSSDDDLEDAEALNLMRQQNKPAYNRIH